jgi:hypothetical protein
MPSPPYPGKETRYPFYRKPGGPQDRSGLMQEISPLPGFSPLWVFITRSRINFTFTFTFVFLRCGGAKLGNWYPTFRNKRVASFKRIEIKDESHIYTFSNKTTKFSGKKKKKKA